jgi:hypothetical protein
MDKNKEARRMPIRFFTVSAPASILAAALNSNAKKHADNHAASHKLAWLIAFSCSFSFTFLGIFTALLRVDLIMTYVFVISCIICVVVFRMVSDSG